MASTRQKSRKLYFYVKHKRIDLIRKCCCVPSSEKNSRIPTSNTALTHTFLGCCAIVAHILFDGETVYYVLAVKSVFPAQFPQRRLEKRIFHFITDVSLESKTGIFDDFTRKILILSIFNVDL